MRKYLFKVDAQRNCCFAGSHTSKLYLIKYDRRLVELYDFNELEKVMDDFLYDAPTQTEIHTRMRVVSDLKNYIDGKIKK